MEYGTYKGQAGSTVEGTLAVSGCSVTSKDLWTKGSAECK